MSARAIPPLNLAFSLLLIFASLNYSQASSLNNLVSLSDITRGELLFRSSELAGYFEPATQLAIEVNIEVTGMVARSTVKQTFENTGDNWVEGIYVFPLPEDSAVDTLKMHIGERIIEGEIQEKEEARATYEAAREAGQRASLVEQERPNMFTTSVANIGPKETIIIEISYLEMLSYDAGKFSMRFPLAITPRYIPGEPLENNLASGTGWALDTNQVPDASHITPPVLPPNKPLRNPVTLKASIDAGFPLLSLESSYHTINISTDGNLNTIELDGPIPADRDFELTWEPDVNSPEAAIFEQTWEDDPYALVMLMPPQLQSVETILQREVILIIDTSGSMSGTSMVQAKEALKLALKRLSPQDKFNVIEFDDEARAFFKQTQPASQRNISSALQQVEHLEANGGTEIAKALNLALGGRVSEGFLSQVVFITDGSVGNESQLFEIITNKLGDTRLFTVGIGSAPNAYFMRKAAEFGRGTYTFIGQVSEVQEKMLRLFEKLENPVLTGLKLQFPRGTEFYPEIIPDLYVGEPILVTAKLPQTGGTVSASAEANNEPWSRQLTLEGKEQVGVTKIWARNKIEALENGTIGESRLNRDAIRENTIQVALKYHLVSDYTSLVAVDKTPARAIDETLDQENMPQNLPAGQDYNAIFGGYPSGATSAALNLLLGVLGILLAVIGLTIRFRYAKNAF